MIFGLLISFFVILFVCKIVFFFYYWISIIFEILHFSFFSYFFTYMLFVIFVNIIFKNLNKFFFLRNNLLSFVPRFSHLSFYISSEISPIWSPNHRFFILHPTNFQFHLILYSLSLNSLHFPLSSQFLLPRFFPFKPVTYLSTLSPLPASD